MTTAAISTGFSQQAFDAFLSARVMSRRGSKPCAARRGSDLTSCRCPSVRDEEWMRTDIRLFKLDRFSSPDSSTDGARALAQPAPHALLAAGVDLAGRAVSIDSRSVEADLNSKLRGQGVLFGSLDALVVEHGELLRPYFERHVVDPFKDKFSALHAAFWCGGTLLYVPKGVRIEQPLHSLSAMADGGNRPGQNAGHSRPKVPRPRCSRRRPARPTGGGLHCGSIELIVEKAARLRYVNLQNWGHEVWHFAHQKAHVGREGRLQWTIGALGSRLAKVNQHVAMTGPDAEVQVNGVMFTEGRQHLSYNTHQHHQAPYCKSDLLYKSALQDRSRTVWRGMIKVDRDAQRTDAYQRNDNLMLSRDARADSIPGLEIEADDVRCTHGSTSGRVDEQQVFYAMTRGYTRREAVRMIVAGFFQQVFDRITIESVRDALGEAIGRRVSDIKELAAS